ncbi:hypothetical protein [Streptomyces sp. NBC_00233]|uniref:hypothetical protein n=1 Tax=Streptomyces sp. NBC_00233 TaxID=2975686 RepID=UPI0022519442|nr:hypothetical protein [Streptomyces sp. NBC_00233]MCX5229932.1 hypothetical protein [Streptomyces sp. NBC_00233]
MPAVYTTLDLAPAVLPDGGGALPGALARPRPEDVDLVVDGRALLHRLDEAEGVDTVSPLAGDLPPALRAEHVRGLLAPDVDAGPVAPLPDGRRVIYSCPDCADLGCGAVTAVVEHDGEDVVWRDFAWQTGPTADPAREGYPGVGPYRFHRSTYRTVLQRLGTPPRPEPQPQLRTGPRAELPIGPVAEARTQPRAEPVPEVPAAPGAQPRAEPLTEARG